MEKWNFLAEARKISAAKTTHSKRPKTFSVFGDNQLIRVESFWIILELNQLK